MTGKPINISIPIKYFGYISLIIVTGLFLTGYFMQNNISLRMEISRIEKKIEDKNIEIAQLMGENEIQLDENSKLKRTIEDKNKIIYEKTQDIDKKLQELNDFKEYIIEYTNMGVGGSSQIYASRSTADSNTNIRKLINPYDEIDEYEIGEEQINTYIGELEDSIEEFKVLTEKVEDRKDYIDSFPDLFPASGTVSSPYGYRVNPFDFKTKEFHSGIDIANSKGTQIFAAGKGRVVETSYNYLYGKYIIINHGYGFTTLYAHLTNIYCNDGDNVEKGELIGTMGSTGKATGPHLHFETRVGGKTVNPLNIKQYYE
jgi:murein DD-endopeptidase MepM/ murein hydrolase activator NlpD